MDIHLSNCNAAEREALFSFLIDHDIEFDELEPNVFSAVIILKEDNNYIDSNIVHMPQRPVKKLTIRQMKEKDRVLEETKKINAHISKLRAIFLFEFESARFRKLVWLLGGMETAAKRTVTPHVITNSNLLRLIEGFLQYSYSLTASAFADHIISEGGTLESQTFLSEPNPFFLLKGRRKRLLEEIIMRLDDLSLQEPCFSVQLCDFLAIQFGVTSSSVSNNMTSLNLELTQDTSKIENEKGSKRFLLNTNRENVAPGASRNNIINTSFAHNTNNLQPSLKSTQKKDSASLSHSGHAHSSLTSHQHILAQCSPAEQKCWDILISLQRLTYCFVQTTSSSQPNELQSNKTPHLSTYYNNSNYPYIFQTPNFLKQPNQLLLHNDIGALVDIAMTGHAAIGDPCIRRAISHQVLLVTPFIALRDYRRSLVEDLQKKSSANLFAGIRSNNDNLKPLVLSDYFTKSKVASCGGGSPILEKLRLHSDFNEVRVSGGRHLVDPELLASSILFIEMLNESYGQVETARMVRRISISRNIVLRCLGIQKHSKAGVSAAEPSSGIIINPQQSVVIVKYLFKNDLKSQLGFLKLIDQAVSEYTRALGMDGIENSQNIGNVMPLTVHIFLFLLSRFFAWTDYIKMKAGSGLKNTNKNKYFCSNGWLEGLIVTNDEEISIGALTIQNCSAAETHLGMKPNYFVCLSNPRACLAYLESPPSRPAQRIRDAILECSQLCLQNKMLTDGRVQSRNSRGVSAQNLARQVMIMQIYCKAREFLGDFKEMGSSERHRALGEEIRQYMASNIGGARTLRSVNNSDDENDSSTIDNNHDDGGDKDQSYSKQDAFSILGSSQKSNNYTNQQVSLSPKNHKNQFDYIGNLEAEVDQLLRDLNVH